MRLRLLDLIVAALLAAAVAIAYATVRHHPFVNYDDPDYVSANAHVRDGLSWEGAGWAWRSTHAGNWFPLTWLSHMADVQMHGASDAGAHHVTSVVLHGAGTVALYLVLVVMTAERWPSASVAALFALLPQHVESVAWIAERKDVLCGLFWFLTIAAYAQYVTRPARWRYAVVVAAFACALMSKSMAVTLPLVLLLLDFWPLGRTGWRGLVREKLPLFAMAIAAGIVTFAAQRGAGAVSAFEPASLPLRAANALVSIVAYLRDLFWPSRLAVFYPYPDAIPAWQIAGAAASVVAMTWVAWRQRRERPWLLVGWLWLLVTLLPVIGLIRIGAQARADRYMYLPSVGPLIVIAWTGRELASRARRARPAIAIVAALACVAAGAATRRQVSYWRDSIALFQHTLAVTSGNVVAHNSLGLALQAVGRLDEARGQFEAAVALKPRYVDALSNLSAVLLSTGRPAEALAIAEAGVRINPRHSEAALNYATALARAGRLDESAAAFRSLVAREPGHAKAHAGLGLVLAAQDRPDAAMASLREAIRIDPRDPTFQYSLGQVAARVGDAEGARIRFIEAIRLKPDFAEAYINLGGVFAGQGRFHEAAAAFASAVRIRPDSAEAHSNLGGALAGSGDLDGAIAQVQEALRLSPGSADVRRNLDLALSMRGRSRRP
jgi:tetratricopeptide (TPR) repeat protein